MVDYNSISGENRAELDSLEAKSAPAGMYSCGYRYRKWFGIRRSSWLLVLYSITYMAFLTAGGFIMAAMEWSNERQLKSQAHQLKTAFLDNHPSVNRSELETLLEAALTAQNMGISVLDKHIDEENWSYGQSILYTVTIVTTIGYGHIAPLTQKGKAFTIVFCILGIPFTLVFLTAVVQRLLEPTYKLLSFFFSRLGEYFTPFSIRMFHLTFMCVLFISFGILMPAAIFMVLEENWAFLDGIYFVFISLTTIGLGDYIPGDREGQPYREIYKTFVAVYLLLGLVFLTLTATVFYDIPQLNLGTVLHKHKDIQLLPDDVSSGEESTLQDESSSLSSLLK